MATRFVRIEGLDGVRRGLVRETKTAAGGSHFESYHDGGWEHWPDGYRRLYVNPDSAADLVEIDPVELSEAEARSVIGGGGATSR